MAQKFNFAKLRNSDRIHWLELINSSQPFPQIIRNLLPQFILLKDEILYDIVCSYIITPSALSNLLPFLLASGISGSGKSTIGKFATTIYGENQHNLMIFGGDTTYANLRRDVSKFIFPKSKNEDNEESDEKYEENVLIAWDDIDLKILKNDQFFRWLKCSYDRLTARTGFVESTKDSKKSTSNYSFCLKCLSSTLPLWEYEEISRRLLVIPCYKGDVNHLLKVEHYDWSGINQMYLKYWMENAESLMTLKRKTRQGLRKLEIPDDMKSTLLDVINVGHYTKFLTREKLMEYMAIANKFIGQSDVLSQALQTFLDTPDYEKEISCMAIRDHQQALYRKGIINREQSSVEALKAKMHSFGFKIKGYKWIKEENQ